MWLVIIIMSDILCTCYNSITKTTGYVLLDNRVSLNQFKKHLINEDTNSQILDHNGKPIDTKERLAELCSGDFKVIIAPKNSQPNESAEEYSPIYPELPRSEPIEPIEPEASEEPIAPENPAESPIVQENPAEHEESPQENQKERFELGETIKSILTRFNVQVSENDEPSDIIKRLPPPFRKMVHKNLHKLKKNPEKLEKTTATLASVFGVPKEDLLRDIQACLDNIQGKGKKLRFSAKCIRRQVDHAQVPNTPAIHRATCDNCANGLIRGIRYKCLQCPDYDLCEECEQQNAVEHFHDSNHIFAKIYRPMIPPMGNGRMMRPHFNRHGPPPHVRHIIAKHAGIHGRIQTLETAVATLQEQIQELSREN